VHACHNFFKMHLHGAVGLALMRPLRIEAVDFKRAARTCQCLCGDVDAFDALAEIDRRRRKREIAQPKPTPGRQMRSAIA
jgi:hypothetical protein